MITENVSTLKIHRLTQEQYDRALADGTLEENALYLTPDSNTEGYVTEDDLNTALTAKANVTHASQHATGGADPLTPEDIGAFNKISVYYNAATSKSIDDLTDGLALVACSDSLNAELYSIFKSGFAYVMTGFFNAASTSSNRFQLAWAYNSTNPKMAIRHYASSWTAWKQVATTDDLTDITAEEVNFSGGHVRVKDVQALYLASTTMFLSSDNVATKICGNAISSSTTVSVASDERVKENIQTVDVDACVEFIKGIDVKTFNYIGNSTPCVGVIAQEVNTLNPELASRIVNMNSDGYYSVKISDMVFPLIATVQRMAQEIEELKAKRN